MLKHEIEKKRAGEGRPFGADYDPNNLAAAFAAKQMELHREEMRLIAEHYYGDPQFKHWSDEEFLEYAEFSPIGERLVRIKQELAAIYTRMSGGEAAA